MVGTKYVNIRSLKSTQMKNLFLKLLVLIGVDAILILPGQLSGKKKEQNH